MRSTQLVQGTGRVLEGIAVLDAPPAQGLVREDAYVVEGPVYTAELC